MPENTKTSLSDDRQANGTNLGDSNSKEGDKTPEDFSTKYITNKIIFYIKKLPVLVVISSLFYLVLANYYISYYNTLSFPFFTLDFPLTFVLNAGYVFLSFLFYLFMYIIIGFLLYRIFHRINEFFNNKDSDTTDYIVLSCIFIAIISFLYFSFMFPFPVNLIIFLSIIIGIRIIDSFKEKYFNKMVFQEATHSVWDWFKNPPMWIFIFVVVYLLNLGLRFFSFPLNILIILSIINATLIFITQDLLKKKFGTSFTIKNLTPLKLLYVCLLIIILLSIPANYLGKEAAENLIKGESGYFQIQFDIKDENISVPNGTLILISQINGYYYFSGKREYKTTIKEDNTTVNKIICNT